MNSTLRNTLALVCLIIVSSTLVFAGGVKTINGGDWNVASNWLGGVVPQSDDDVIVNGNVINVSYMNINNLVINSGASISAVKPPGSGAEWNIGGSLTNNGTIGWGDAINPMNFSIRVYGTSIRNDGSFTASALEIRGNDAHTVTLGNGANHYFDCVISASQGFFNGKISLDNNMHILKSMDIAAGIEVMTNEHTFTGISDGGLYGGIIIGNTKLYDLKIGNVEFRSEVELLGNISLMGPVILKGKTVNSGTVTGNQTVSLYAELKNVNSWNGSIVIKDSVLISNEGTYFGGTVLTTESIKGFSLVGEAHFDTYSFNNHPAYLTNTIFTKGMLIDSKIITSSVILDSCIVVQGSIKGNVVFKGGTIIRYITTIDGGVTVHDSLFNDGTTNQLIVKGSFSNSGEIMNLNLILHGNIVNNGTWTNYPTQLSGDIPRTISLAPGKLFRGEIKQSFVADTTNTVTVLSDLIFGNTVDLAAGVKWIVSGQSLSTTGNAIFYGGLISGNVVLKKFHASSPIFKGGNVTVSEASSLEGALFYSTVTNNDSVKANNVSLFNDLQNNKWWNVYATSVKESLSIVANPGSTFGANLTVLKDGLRLYGEFDFQYYDIGGFRVYGKQAIIKNALQINNARLFGGVIEGSLLRAASELYDSITFRGTTKIRSVVNIGGWLLNKDSLIADPSEGNVEMKVDGDIVNHGTMLGVPVSVTGDIINHGEWTEKTTNMTGSNPRRIFLASGKIFPGEMNRVSPDSAGILYALSDLRMSPGKWLNMDKGTLVANKHSLTVPGVLHGRIKGPVRFVGKNSAPYFLHVQDSMLVSDSLFMNGEVKIFGPITNQGVLESNGTASFYHSIENNGEWKIPTTKLYVNKGAKSNIRFWNTSGNPLTVQQPTLTGDYPERFAIVEGNQSVSVPAGEAHQIAVRYVDTNQIIYHQAQLNIPSTGIGTLSTVMLYGDTTGSMLVPLVEFNANSFPFGQLKLDSMYTQRLIIRNPRANQLRIDTAFTKGGIFTASVLKRISENNDSAVVEVVLVPKTFGLYGDTLIIKTNAFPYIHKFALSAAAPQPNLSASSGFFQFPQTAVGDSTQMLVKLKNNSLNALTIDSIRHPKPIFHLLPLPSVIGPNDSVTVVLRFRPAGFGVQQDSVKIYSNGGVAVIRFSGESPFPNVTVSSLIHSFGQVKLKDTATAALKMMNASINPVVIQSIVFRQQMYTLADTPKTIGRNDSVQLTIRFIPAEFKVYNDTLSIVTNGGNFLVLVNGSSPKPILVSIAPQLNFGTVIVDSTRMLTLRMTNTSINTAVIDSARTGTKQFKIGGITSGAMINNKDTITVSISFTPDTSRSFSDTAMVFTNSVTPIVLVSLLGNGSRSTWVDQMRNSIPVEFTLFQNYPNPFNPSTTIRYGLPSSSSHVSLKIYNVLGQQIADLVNTEQSAGWYETVWNANVSSGLYFYRIEAVSSSEPNKQFTQLKKMILLK